MSAVLSSLAPQPRLELPVKLLPILEPRRFKVLHGGRGGAKSHTVAQVLVMLSMRKRVRILCVRAVQKSLKESSMQVLKDYIEHHGLSAYFEPLQTEIRCRTTGSTFNFVGLQNHTATSIKSWEGADIVWVEEAQSVSAHSWTILIPTIRKAGSEIWLTFNPDDESGYAWDRFVVNDDPDAWVVQINWRDNPWFVRDGEMDRERRKLKAINDDLYQHVWEGRPRTAAGLLFKRAWFEPRRYELGEHPENLALYLGSDYASTDVDDDDVTGEPDWTEHGVFGLDTASDIWVTDWWSGQTDPEVWIAAAIQLLRRHEPLAWFEEAGPIARAVKGALNRRLREDKVWVYRHAMPSIHGKVERAMGFAARAAAGAVHIPRCAWGDRLVNQLCAFNGQDGRIDDMVDACSVWARGLDLMGDAIPEKPAEDAPIIPFSRAHIEGMDRVDRDAEARRRDHYR